MTKQNQKFAPNREVINELIEADKARVVGTALEGTCSLVEVDSLDDKVVVLADNTTMFHQEDLKDDPVFPLPLA